MLGLVACDAAAAFLWCARSVGPFLWYARSVVPPTSCVGDPVLVPVSQVLPAPQVLLPASQVSGFAGTPVLHVLPVE